MGQLITTPNGVVSIRSAGPEDAVIVRDLHWVEAPRGELSYFLKSNGSEKPERIKVSTPSICNWSSVLILPWDSNLRICRWFYRVWTRVFHAMTGWWW